MKSHEFRKTSIKFCQNLRSRNFKGSQKITESIKFPRILMFTDVISFSIVTFNHVDRIAGCVINYWARAWSARDTTRRSSSKLENMIKADGPMRNGNLIDYISGRLMASKWYSVLLSVPAVNGKAGLRRIPTCNATQCEYRNDSF